MQFMSLEGQMGTIDLHDTTDVAVWAAEFCRIFPHAPDEGVMIGWFANAMMAKSDAIFRADHALRAGYDLAAAEARRLGVELPPFEQLKGEG